jgi:hypothetical protein
MTAAEATSKAIVSGVHLLHGAIGIDRSMTRVVDRRIICNNLMARLRSTLVNCLWWVTIF